MRDGFAHLDSVRCIRERPGNTNQNDQKTLIIIHKMVHLADPGPLYLRGVVTLIFRIPIVQALL